MINKKICSLAIATFLLGSAAVTTTTTVYAQTIGQCTNATVDEVFTGSNVSALVRFSNRRCGISGQVCMSAENDLSAADSNRAFASALTAQATGATFSIIRYDQDALGCGGFPMLTEMRLQPAS